MKIKFLYHSGFCVETRKNLLLFDYYQGEAEGLVKSTPKQVVIFCSHSHPDHFNPVILDWQKDRPDIHYIFSRDIRPGQRVENLHYLVPDETIETAGLKIKAFNSTDIGVAFWVEDEGTRIFHAGDLNWWYWIDTPEEMAKAEREFKEEIEIIKSEDIDIAFFPVDPRLEKNYSAGAEYFIEKVGPKVFIPMHFADSPEITDEFRNAMKGCPSRIIILNQKGQEEILL
ncbi:MBL fold metallo-hydrolase [Desulfosporosinus orientis]|uniref:MBL fold metallo-hydrolase n=1 Tax=Desulfosporosinus orientis TaxID=1563 RepID=UPI001FA7973E|nr:MBL fold metallo-hydrolase [Desulfosporosinus orientis]